MKIWHQSYTDLTVMPLYQKTLTEHAAKVMGAAPFLAESARRM